jgi:hypothetical protein
MSDKPKNSSKASDEDQQKVDLHDLAWEHPTPEAQRAIARLQKREEMGLGHLPLHDGDEVFRDITQPELDITEIIEDVAGWFVRKDMKFYDVNNISTSLNVSDMDKVVLSRIREKYPYLELDDDLITKLFATLFSNKLDPMMVFKIWDGRALPVPTNSQRLIYKDGFVSINTWVQPEYRSKRQTKPGLGAFERLLDFAIKEPAERDMLLNWLAWCLQNENDKPSWAVFLYSDEKGTGKSTIANVARSLFGSANTASINGVKKLVGRFNKNILEKKLVIAEEVQIRPNSDHGNALKDIITSDFATVEQKGKDTEEIQHKSCFILTTNHKPIWLEGKERRYYILHISHDGHNQGAEYEVFKSLVKQVNQEIADPDALANIYGALMKRELPAEFDAHSLDFERHATAVMREIEGLSPDATRQVLDELFEYYNVRAIPNVELPRLMQHFRIGSMNTPKYHLDTLGFELRRLAWSGGKTAGVWVKREIQTERGRIQTTLQDNRAPTSMNETQKIEGWYPLGDFLDKTWGRLLKSVVEKQPTKEDGQATTWYQRDEELPYGSLGNAFESPKSQEYSSDQKAENDRARSDNSNPLAASAPDKKNSKKETQAEANNKVAAENRRVETSTGAFQNPTGTERPGDDDPDPEIIF